MTERAVIVLGGGLNEDGSLNPWSRARADRALEIADKDFDYFITTSAYTLHKPPKLDHEGFPIIEAHELARYLRSAGIPKERLLVEAASHDTIGNAYFSRTLHLEPLDFDVCTLVTSAFHLERATAVFDWVFSLSPALQTELNTDPAENSGLDSEALQARAAREKKQLRSVRRKREVIQNKGEFCRWLFTEHDAYAPGQPDQKCSNEARKTY